MISFTYINNNIWHIGYAISEQVAIELLDRWGDDFEETYKLVSTHTLDFTKLSDDDIIYEDCFGGYTKQHFTLNRK